jgi:hypothetical protein
MKQYVATGLLLGEWRRDRQGAPMKGEPTMLGRDLSLSNA